MTAYDFADFNSAEAEDFLGERLGHDVGHAEMVGEGAWSRCFAFVDDGREQVIRFGAFVDDFEKDQRAGAWHSDALPIPEVTEVGKALDGYYAISSRVHGKPLETASEGEWRALLPDFFGMLDAMRAIDTSDTHGYGGWDKSGNAPLPSWRDHLLKTGEDTPERRTHGWRRKLNESPVGDEVFVAGLGKLAELTDPDFDERHVIHADLINRNVLVEDGHIAGVFDWGCSAYGDSLYDIAWLKFWSPWYPALEAIDIVAESKKHFDEIGVEVKDFDRRLRCCLIHIGLDHIGYNAFLGKHDDLETVNNMVADLIKD